MCTRKQDGKYYDENGKRLFTSQEVLTATVAFGHTSGKPEERAAKERIIAEATADHYCPLPTAG